jgi:hypothetical protein
MCASTVTENQEGLTEPPPRIYNLWKKPFTVKTGEESLASPSQDNPAEIVRAKPRLANGGVRVLRG